MGDLLGPDPQDGSGSRSRRQKSLKVCQKSVKNFNNNKISNETCIKHFFVLILLVDLNMDPQLWLFGSEIKNFSAPAAGT